MKIVALESLGVNSGIIDGLSGAFTAAGHEFVYCTDGARDDDTLAKRLCDADIAIITNMQLSGNVIRSAAKLKMISVAFIGIDHIDANAIKEKGITVCNAAGYCNHSVTELVFALTFAVLRNITAGDALTRAGKTREGIIGNELHGKTFGVVGAGVLGSSVAVAAAAFGCRVVANDKNERRTLLDLGVRYFPLDELLAISDVVSLHVPLIPETRGLISRERLALMKPEAILINCARGPVVDNAALADALNTGKLRGAGIDVFDMEPPIPLDYPLLKAKNTVLAPHVAFATAESSVRRAEITFGNITAYLNGSPVNVML